jgi:hypothetical protein
MAKPIVISVEGASASFQHAKVDRARLYGAKKRLALDEQGAPCQRSALTADGRYILQSGMTAQGYFDAAGAPVSRAELVTIAPDGSVLPVLPSTLGAPQVAEIVPPDTVLDYVMESHYVLEPETVDPTVMEALDGGQIFRFPFNATPGVNCETGFLLKSGEQLFCLVGNPVTATWSEPAVVVAVDAQEEDSSDELDFDMF